MELDNQDYREFADMLADCYTSQVEVGERVTPEEMVRLNIIQGVAAIFKSHDPELFPLQGFLEDRDLYHQRLPPMRGCVTPGLRGTPVTPGNRLR